MRETLLMFVAESESRSFDRWRNQAFQIGPARIEFLDAALRGLHLFVGFGDARVIRRRGLEIALRCGELVLGLQDLRLHAVPFALVQIGKLLLGLVGWRCGAGKFRRWLFEKLLAAECFPLRI